MGWHKRGIDGSISYCAARSSGSSKGKINYCGMMLGFTCHLFLGSMHINAAAAAALRVPTHGAAGSTSDRNRPILPAGTGGGGDAAAAAPCTTDRWGF